MSYVEFSIMAMQQSLDDKAITLCLHVLPASYETK